MNPLPPPVAMNATLQEAAQTMADSRVSWLPVEGRSGMVGGISQEDIVCRSTAKGESPTGVRVADIMTLGIICCQSADRPLAALHLMQRYGIPRIGVIDEENSLVGVISEADILRSRERSS